MVDPLDDPATPPGTSSAPGPEAATILRDDVRFAVVVALQRLSPRQRAALILHDVCDCPVAEVSQTIRTNPNATKALLHRARAALAAARRQRDVDPVADRAVVDRLVRAIEMRSVEAFTALLAEDVWGVTDGGGLPRVSTKPVFGVRAVSRLWANADRRQLLPVAAHIRVLNGEPAAIVTVPDAGNAVMASIHIETRRGQIAALRVIRDPRKLGYIGPEHARNGCEPTL